MTRLGPNDEVALLHAALQFPTFTVEQLAELTGIKASKVQATVAFATGLFEEVERPDKSKSGRTPKLYRLRDGARLTAALEAVNFAAKLSRQVALDSDQAAAKVKIVLDAVASSITSGRDPGGTAAATLEWGKRAADQLALSRRLIQFVSNSSQRAELQWQVDALQSESTRRPRILKRYTNRRLYDTVESRYITLADIRKLVIDRIDFVVIDKTTRAEMTRLILLEVVSEQEHSDKPLLTRDLLSTLIRINHSHAGESLFSLEFLSDLIRLHGGAHYEFVASYLEQTVKLFLSQQLEARNRAGSAGSGDFEPPESNLAQKNYQRWRLVQDEISRTLMNPGSTNSTLRRSEEDNEPSKELE